MRMARGAQVLPWASPSTKSTTVPGSCWCDGIEWQSISRQVPNCRRVVSINWPSASWNGCQNSRTRSSASAKRSLPR